MRLFRRQSFGAVGQSAPGRFFLAAITLGALEAAGGPTQAADLLPGQARFVLRLDPDDSPEGIAVAPDGTVYVGNRYPTEEGLGAQILRIGDDGHVSVLTTFAPTASPFAFGILGLALDAGGDVYAALHTLDPQTHGVWRIRKNGKNRSRLAGSEAMFIPNALTFDDDGNLYATDSVGAIWRFRPQKHGEPGIVWAVHDLLAPFFDFDPIALPDGPVALPGANGIAFGAPNHLYVANTERALLVRVSIAADGTAEAPQVVAGDVANPYTPLLTIDGIAADSQGNVHAVVPGSVVLSLLGIPASPLVKIDPESGAIDFTVTDPAVAFDFFHTPLSLASGTLPGDGNTVFVTNGAQFADLIPGPGPSIVQVGVLPPAH
jgi:sugar lactone lactonase YvrE